MPQAEIGATQQKHLWSVRITAEGELLDELFFDASWGCRRPWWLPRRYRTRWCPGRHAPTARLTAVILDPRGWVMPGEVEHALPDVARRFHVDKRWECPRCGGYLVSDQPDVTGRIMLPALWRFECVGAARCGWTGSEVGLTVPGRDRGR